MNYEILPKPGAKELPKVLRQKFEVSYEYPVYFLRNLFDPAETALIDAITRYEADKRHRCMVFLDDGLARARPCLVQQIERWFSAHSARQHASHCREPSCWYRAARP